MSSSSLKPLQYRSYANQFRNWYKKPVAQTSSAVILTVFAIAFFGLAAIRPTLTTITMLLREIEDKQAYDEELTKKLNNLTTVQKKYTDSQQVLGIFNQVLPNDQGINQLFAQIEAISENNNVTLYSVNTGDVTTFKETNKTQNQKNNALVIEEYQVSISLKGNMVDLSRWLFEFKNIERLIEIKQISIRPSNEQLDTSTQIKDMSVQAIIYWIPNP